MSNVNSAKNIYAASLVAFFVFLTSFGSVDAVRPAIGPNINSYTRPSNCDISVPEQYPTIQQGINASLDGDTVCVGPGTYKENIFIPKTITLSGSGVGTNKSVIVGQKNNYSSTVRIAGNNSIIEGFVIRGAGTTYQTAAVNITASYTGVTIRYNRIAAHSGELAFRGDGQQNAQTIHNNIFVGNNSPQIALITGTPSVGQPSNNISFINNKFVGTVAPDGRDDSGIILGTQATNNTITGNIFKATGTIHEIIQCAYSSNTITMNNLYSATFSPLTNTPVKVRAGYDGVTNATNNWWGDLDPSDNIQGDINYTPFSTRAFINN